MAATKSDTKSTDTPTGDLGKAEVQSAFDEANAKGYFGTAPDPVPDEQYSLKTGPDAPSAVADPTTRVAQHSAVTEEK